MVQSIRTTIGCVLSIVALGGCAAASSGDGISSSTVIGRGYTLAGKSFIATSKPISPLVIGSGGSECPLPIFIHEQGGRVNLEQCYSRDENPVRPQVECVMGLITVHMETGSATRRVRLTLSNGRSVVSATMLVPSRLGGPARIYYQALRGPTPIPASLTEFNGNGHRPQTMPVRRLLECTKEESKVVHGSVHTLAKVRAPGGRYLR